MHVRFHFVTRNIMESGSIQDIEMDAAELLAFSIADTRIIDDVEYTVGSKRFVYNGGSMSLLVGLLPKNN